MTYTVWSSAQGDYVASVEQDKYSSCWRGIVFCRRYNYTYYQYDFYATRRSAIAAMRRQLRKLTE